MNRYKPEMNGGRADLFPDENGDWVMYEDAYTEMQAIMEGAFEAGRKEGHKQAALEQKTLDESRARFPARAVKPPEDVEPMIFVIRHPGADSELFSLSVAKGRVTVQAESVDVLERYFAGCLDVLKGRTPGW